MVIYSIVVFFTLEMKVALYVVLSGQAVIVKVV
jgi:hypothetical protein